MLGDLNGRAISLVEVREAVNEMKSDKAPGLDGFPVKCLKKGGMAVLEWLFRRLSIVGKFFGRVLNKRVTAGTDCGFRQGRGCMDQVFDVR